MSPSEQIALAWEGFVRTLRLVGRVQLWLPWLVIGIAQGIALLLIWWFAHPLVSRFMAPLVQAVGGEDALHYPDIFSHMPGLYARADMVLVASLGAVMLGASTQLFAHAHTGAPLEAGRAMWKALRHAGTLIVILLPLNALLVLLSIGLGAAVADQGALVQRAAYVFGLGASVMIQAFFLYVTQLAMLERRGIGATFSALSRTWRHGFLAALVLGVMFLLPLLPLHFVSGQTARIVERGSPDLIGLLVFAQLMVALAAGFLLNGSATLVYLSAMTRREEMEA